MSRTHRIVRAGVRAVPWLAVLPMLAHCSHPARMVAPPPDTRPVLVARAHASAAEGCYRCLADALTAYEEALALRAEPALAQSAYRVAVHLAIRERLLGLYPGSYQGSPARLAAGAAPEDRDAATEVLGALPWRRGTSGLGITMVSDRSALDALRARRDALEARADADAWAATLLLALIGTSPFLAVDADQRFTGATRPRLDPDRWWRRHPEDRALTFTRLALLRDTTMDDWHLLLQQSPGFVDAWAMIGEATLATGRLLSADEALARALDAMPALVPARVIRGDIQQRMENHAEALACYDAVLQRVPDHREALLGRLQTLGFLARHEEAVAVADVLIAKGVYYQGEARYWKAWNFFHLSRLPDARAALDQARGLIVSSDVHYLGGVIAYRQDRLDDALADFDAAASLDGAHCESRFDRAAIHQQRRGWPQAATGFDEAFDCLAARAPALAQRVEEAHAARLADAAREALVARRERAVLDNQRQQAWARYNGGVAHANAGRTGVARAHAEQSIRLGGPAADPAQRLLAQLPPR